MDNFFIVLFYDDDLNKYLIVSIKPNLLQGEKNVRSNKIVENVEIKLNRLSRVENGGNYFLQLYSIFDCSIKEIEMF